MTEIGQKKTKAQVPHIDTGETLYEWATELFPLCRSLSGQGVLDTLKFLQQKLPNLKLKYFNSGDQVFDWQVPHEWNVQDAYVADEAGNRLIDFKVNNLHLMGYSVPVCQRMSIQSLDQYLYSLPEQPNAIPYVTSYYKPRWGFCLTHAERLKLLENPNQEVEVKIDSSLKPGRVYYGELLIPGENQAEILFSTYVCHPSMANNELSGPCVATALGRWLEALPKRKYSYRILFLVETLGAIAYLSEHHHTLSERTKAGFVLSCVGDDNAYSYIASRASNTLADRVLTHVLTHQAPAYQAYSFLERGSDERQYCSPGIDLPVVGFCRSKYATYPEYHTSLDNLSLISSEGLDGALNIMRAVIEVLEHNEHYRVTTLCEPQLGRRGLYPTLSTATSGLAVRNMMNLLAYADGDKDLIEIAEQIQVSALELLPILSQLLEKDLLSVTSQNS